MRNIFQSSFSADELLLEIEKILDRLFHLYLGMSIKSFSRLVRINKAIRLLCEKENTVALVCEKLGYYDSSHLVKDFKTVCNIAPQEFKNKLSDFYSEIAKF